MMCFEDRPLKSGLHWSLLLAAAVIWVAYAGAAGAQIPLFGPQRPISIPDPDGIVDNGNEGNADGSSRVQAADLDGDGDLDVISASARDDKIAWYENTDGLGTFGAQKVITTSGDGPSSVFPGDIDGDGDMDIVTGSRLDDKIAWHENIDGLGTFSAQRIINIPDPDGIPDNGNEGNADEVFTAFPVDLDGDGDLDVLSASFRDGKIAWHENMDGEGAFGPQRLISTSALGAISAFAADLDGDGDMDVLSASTGDDKIAWYENLSNSGTFGGQQVIATSADDPIMVRVGDLDGDGDLDVLSTSTVDDKIAWYENTDGDGDFSAQRVITTSAKAARSVFVADLDGDGDLDVLSTSFLDDKVAWYENTNGAGDFGPQIIINVADPDGIPDNGNEGDADGAPDVLSASIRDDKVAWYKNLAVPPSAPGAGLSVAVVINEPSEVRPGQTVTYDYLFRSDDGVSMLHANRGELFDLIDDPALIRPGQVWTVTITPVSNGLSGMPMTAKVEILDPKLGVARWKFYD